MGPDPVDSTMTITLPDDAPHDCLTEWWYHNGHLTAENGERYGFELCFFQFVRGLWRVFETVPRGRPLVYVGHYAISDHQRGRHTFAARSARGSQIERGFDLSIGPWRMGGNDGEDRIRAAMDGYGIDLTLRATKPPVLQDRTGLLAFTAAGSSYYYSRTRLEVSGCLDDAGQRHSVSGQAWFDHQWGDFLVLGFGWDWFSVQLEDGADLMVNVIRDQAGEPRYAYGTYVDPGGRAKHLPADRFSIEPLGSWTSPRSGIRYPMGWQVDVADPWLALRIRPVFEDQEMHTVESSGKIYWEGECLVEGSTGDGPIGGLAYVELVGYAARSALVRRRLLLLALRARPIVNGAIGWAVAGPRRRLYRRARG